MTKMRNLVTLGAILTITPLLWAQSEEMSSELETIRVISESQDDVRLPFAPQKVSKEKIETFQYTDVNRALKQISGVYVREEDAQGLRPNIGLRGTNPDRSKKIILMEDGVLIGPAPYAAPAAYYTPNMNHVESLEVHKGFKAVPYGPNSVGGAINYITRSIPQQRAASVDAFGGSFNTQNYKARIGESFESFGYHVEGSRISTDGFKKLDGGGNSGFVRHDIAPQFRMVLNKDSARPQYLTLRLGYADEDSKETYLGLTHDDFTTDPYRRYAASAWDEMKWHHGKIQIEHILQTSDTSFLKTVAYNHQFKRAWYRLDSLGSGKKILDVIKDPVTNQIEYDIISGKADSSSAGGNLGDLIVANNDREYYSRGLQTKYSTSYLVGTTLNESEISLRLHQDSIRRDHTYDTGVMTGGELVKKGVPRQQSAKNSDKAFATTLSLLNNTTVDKWILTAVGRFESAEFEFHNDLTSETKKRSDTAFVPGLGALYMLDDSLSARASVNKGVTLAGLDSSGKEVREESNNYELGVKYASDDQTRFSDITVFYNDYQNLTGTCTVSSGCTSATDSSFNGGEAEVLGIEAQYTQGFSMGQVWIPVTLNATWIQAQWKNSFTTDNAEWGTVIENGDPLPYIPSYFYTISIGTEYKNWKQEVAIVYQGKMYDQSSQIGRETIDAFGIVDWSGRYSLSKKSVLYAKIDNVLGREYAVSMRPFGYRPGKPRSVGVGFNYAF